MVVCYGDSPASLQVSDTLAALVERSEHEDGVELPHLTAMFSPGAIVHCVIIGMDKTQHKRRIELSLRATELNREVPLSAVKEGAAVYGAVKSKEDRGWLVDLGMHQLQG